MSNDTQAIKQATDALKKAEAAHEETAKRLQGVETEIRDIEEERVAGAAKKAKALSVFGETGDDTTENLECTISKEGEDGTLRFAWGTHVWTAHFKAVTP